MKNTSWDARQKYVFHTYFLDKWSVGSTVERGYEHFTCGDWKGQEGKQASDVYMGSCNNVSYRTKSLAGWHVRCPITIRARSTQEVLSQERAVAHHVTIRLGQDAHFRTSLCIFRFRDTARKTFHQRIWEEIGMKKFVYNTRRLINWTFQHTLRRYV